MKKNCTGTRLIFAVWLLVSILVLGVSKATAQDLKLTIKETSVPLKTILSKIEKASGYRFLFNDRLVDSSQRITISKENADINSVLKDLFDKTDINFKIVDRQIILSSKTAGAGMGEIAKNTPQTTSKNNNSAKKITVKGKVLDDNGRSIPGATISVKGYSGIGTVTSVNGTFSFEVPATSSILIVSFIGFSSEEITLSNKESYIVTLKPENKRMEELVVTGYQTLKKYNTTGSVKSLDSKAINTKSNLPLDKLLEGVVPGLVVYKGDYKIRGGSSLNSGTKPMFIVDDFEVESLPQNMAQVESITVLKDAAAAAIWGSRAANGVIVITTKQGKSNDFKVSYTNNFEISEQPDFSNLHKADSKAMLDYQKEAYQKGYILPSDYAGRINGYPDSYQIFFDHYNKQIDDIEMERRLTEMGKLNNKKQIEKYLLRNSFRQEHYLSVSGGSDKVNYIVSGSFTNGNSSYKGDSYSNTQINSRTSYKLYSFLKFRTDIAATFSNNNSGYSSLSSDIYSLYPFQMLVDDKGGYVYNYNTFNKTEADRLKALGFLESGKNLIEEVKLANNKTIGKGYKVRLGSDLKLFEGVNLSVDYQYELSNSETKNIQSKDAYYARTLINRQTAIQTGDVLKRNIPYGDILDKTNSSSKLWVVKTGLTLNKTFGENNEHYINAIAGFEIRRREVASEKFRKLGYDDQLLTWQPTDQKILAQGFKWWNNSTSTYSSELYDGFSYNDNREKSTFGSVVYTYNERYTLSGTLRFDESNLFGADKKFRRNPIWSVGASWNIAKEKFFATKSVDDLTLRATYGLTGNFDRSGSTTPLLTASRTYISSVGDYVTRIISPPNPKLRWEKTRSLNISLDVSLFNRVSATLEFYNNYSYDLLGNTVIDPTLGFETARINAADMKNQGFELSVNGDILRLNGFKWFAGFVLSYNQNKILNNKITDSTPQYTLPTSTVYKEGYPRESIWSYKWAGLNEKGDPQTYGKDGNKALNVSVESLEFSGTFLPKYNGSFNTGFSYKGIQLGCLFVYNFGHIFRVEYPSMNPYELYPSINEKIAQRWEKPGDESKTDIPAIPIIDWSNYQLDRDIIATLSSNSIRKGGFVRLRDISLNYQLPATIVSKTFFKNIALIAQISNVALWTQNSEGYDPEAVQALSGKFSLAQPTSLTVGLKLDL